VNILKKKRKIPKFRKQEVLRYVRVGGGYRKPKGFQSKMRQRVKGNLAIPEPGYGMPAELRHLHPSGLRETLVNTSRDFEGADPMKNIIRIGGNVGYKKKLVLLELAKKGGFRVANPPKMRQTKEKEAPKEEPKKEEPKTEEKKEEAVKPVEAPKKAEKKTKPRVSKPTGSPRGTRK